MLNKWLSSRKTISCKVVLTISLFSAAFNAHAQKELIFGVYTADKPTAMVRTYRPFLSALETRLSQELKEPVKIKLQVASSYQKGIDSLVEGRVDFSMIGPASYVEASNREPALKILAVESKDGAKTTVKGVICVREDSEIKTLADLNGKRFAFGNERSTIGRYLSQALLVSHGVYASKLSSFDYLGRHDRVAHAVSQGTHDAGALKQGTYNKLNKKGLGLRVLETISTVNLPWVASAKLDKKIFDALQLSMLTLKAPKAFKSMGKKQFVKASEADFSEIRSAINDNVRFFSSKSAPLASSEE